MLNNLLTLLDGNLEGTLCHLVHHVLHTKVHVRGVPSDGVAKVTNLKVVYVQHQTCDAVNELVFVGLCHLKVPEVVVYLVPVGTPTTGDVSVGPTVHLEPRVCVPELEVVGVVNHTSLDATRVPVKGCVTARAPHLGAPTNLVYECPARGTGFGVPLDELEGLEGLWVALMTLLLLLVALVTYLTLAQSAVPLGVQETMTVLTRTLSGIVELDVGSPTTHHTTYVIRFGLHLPLLPVELPLGFVHLLLQVLDFIPKVTELVVHHNNGLGLWEVRLLPLEQHILTMVLVILTNVVLVTHGIHELPVELLLAVHAVRVQTRG